MVTTTDPDLATTRAIGAERDRLLHLVRASLAQSRRLDALGPNGGGEDEANYALTWQVLHLLTGDEDAAAHCHELFADLRRWVETECVGGYEAEAEAHHGTEPFLLFLPRYAALFASEAAVDLVCGAAEHIGNWVPGQPPWYDFERDHFVSWQLGARAADVDPNHRYEHGDHWRFIHIALAAHALRPTDRYAQWALRYGRARARRILAASDPLPAEWDLNGEPLPHDWRRREHQIAGDPLIGIEEALGSGAIHALADCFALEPDPIFREAAARLAAPLVPILGDPYADPAAAALRRFRLGFADDRFDAAIAADSAGWCLDAGPEHLVLPPQARRSDHGPGVGRRRDMQRWYLADADGTLRPSPQACPAAATLAWDVTGDLRFPLHALRLAADRSEVAIRALRSGREHADKGCSIASVMAGHGRNWGTGAVTGCLQPLLAGGDVIASRLVPAAPVPIPTAGLRLVRSGIDGVELRRWES